MTRDDQDWDDERRKPEDEVSPTAPADAMSDSDESIDEPIEARGEPDLREEIRVEEEPSSQTQFPTESLVGASDESTSNQPALDRFLEDYRAQQEARRANGESEQPLLPADAPLRRKDGYVYAERRRLPPPTPFEDLVFSYGKPRTPDATAEIEERWLPPDFVPQGSPQPTGAPAHLNEGEIKVTVEVRLTSEARERIAEQAIAKAARTHQDHTEIIAKRLYELTREIRDREAERRRLYRR